MMRDNHSVRRRPQLKRLFDNQAPALEPPASSLQVRASSLEKANKRPWPPAVWRLIATFTNSKIGSSHSKHRTSHFSNRNKNTHSCLQLLCVPRRLFTLSGTEGRGPSFLIANRILESPATPSKQTIGTTPNREKVRAPLRAVFSCHSPLIARPSSPLFYDTFLRGAKQNWRNFIYA
jgi:hypothetical protein